MLKIEINNWKHFLKTLFLSEIISISIIFLVFLLHNYLNKNILVFNSNVYFLFQSNNIIYLLTYIYNIIICGFFSFYYGAKIGEKYNKLISSKIDISMDFIMFISYVYIKAFLIDFIVLCIKKHSNSYLFDNVFSDYNDLLKFLTNSIYMFLNYMIYKYVFYYYFRCGFKWKNSNFHTNNLIIVLYFKNLYFDLKGFIKTPFYSIYKFNKLSNISMTYEKYDYFLLDVISEFIFFMFSFTFAFLFIIIFFLIVAIWSFLGNYI